MKNNRMKKKLLMLVLTMFFMQVNAQEKEEGTKLIWLRNTGFFFTNSFYVGDNMIADSHRLHSMGGDVKLGIVRYNNIGLTLFAGFTKLKVDDTQMIGNVTSSTLTKGGATLFYQWEISPVSTFKPEIGVYDLSFKSFGDRIDIESMSGMGLLFGTDYQYNITKGFRGVVGLHYHWNNYNVRTAPAYRSYFKRAQYIQLSVGFNF